MGVMRTFDTGATRTDDRMRDDPEGYLSPLVLDRYCEYMTKHRVQADGTVRDSDNWQKGLPAATYMKGLLRHLLHAWTRHRGHAVRDPLAATDIEEDLCAVIFNAQGYLQLLVAARQRLRDVVQTGLDQRLPLQRWDQPPTGDGLDDDGIPLTIKSPGELAAWLRGNR